MIVLAPSDEIRVCEKKEVFLVNMTLAQPNPDKEIAYDIKFEKFVIPEITLHILSSTKNAMVCNGLMSFGERCQRSTNKIVYSLEQIQRIIGMNMCLVGESCVKACEGEKAERCLNVGELNFVSPKTEDIKLQTKANVFAKWCSSMYSCSIEKEMTKPYWISLDKMRIELPTLETIEMSVNDNLNITNGIHVYFDKIPIIKTEVVLRCFKGEMIDCRDKEDGNSFVLKNGMAIDWNTLYIEKGATTVVTLDDDIKFDGAFAKVYDLQRVFNQIIFETSRSNNNFAKIQNRILNNEMIIKSVLYNLYNLTIDPLELYLNGHFKADERTTKDNLVLNPCVDRDHQEIESGQASGIDVDHSINLFSDVDLNMENIKNIKFNVHNYLQHILRKLEEREKRKNDVTSQGMGSNQDWINDYLKGINSFFKSCERAIVWFSFIVVLLMLYRRL